ncbi:Smr/MutS family protein [bacterium]|nr:Smr/MutS family protein [bacterium]
MESTIEALEFNQIREYLANSAESEAGREILSVIKPSSSIEWVRSELKRVDEVRRFFDRGGSIASGGLKDLRSILKKSAVRSSVLSIDDLLSLLEHLRVHSRIRKTLNRERETLPAVYRLTSTLQPISSLEDQLARTITPEATIRDDATPELARLRKAAVMQLNLMRSKLTAMLPRLIKQGVLREQSFSVRDGRYVLPVRSDSLPKVKGIIHDRSASGGTLFVEPAIMITLGNELRSIELAERDEVRRILLQLSDKVRDNLDVIQENLRVMTVLDCICAKAGFAVKIDAYVPDITENGVIKILGGCHPLLLLRDQRKVVPLTLELGVDFTTLVISGPNSGGKSVALKCIGLLCLMTACGIPIPALPGTSIPLFKTIQADIGDQQSIRDDLSTFTAHAAKLKEIVETANHNTLVLIDEIGAGTDPQEGSSLSIAALEELTSKGVPTIVTTHHGALKAFAHSTEKCANGSMEFNLKTFEPTFRFQPNMPGSSYALAIASRVGLSDKLIERAKDVLGADHTRVEDLIVSLTEKVQHYESLLVDEDKQARSTKALEDAYREKIERLKTREKEFKHKAREEIEDLIKEARRTVEAVVKEIRENQADKDSILKAHEQVEKLKDIVKEKTKRRRKKNIDKITSSDDLKTKSKGKKKKISSSERKNQPTELYGKTPEIGDTVKLDESASTGEITAISSKGDKVCVAVGAVQLWVAKNRVTVMSGKVPDSNSGKSSVKMVTLPKKTDVPLELDIRGYTVEEALIEVDKYIYDGRAQGRTKLGIIHGKGTGALTHAVREALGKHTLVESFRFGEHGEGDFGVTVVSLKD